LGDDFGGYDVGVERTAELVDVEAVGAGVSDDDLAAKVGEELRSDRRGGSVGAVDDDALVIEREAGNGVEEEANVLGAVGFVDRGRLQIWIRWCGSGFEVAEDLVFDG